MTDIELKLIDEKFSGLTKLVNAQFGAVDTKLEMIHEQTKKTNGRVTELEDAFYTDKEYVHHVIDTRVTDCPNVKIIAGAYTKIDTLEKSLEDVSFFIRHPKLAVAILTGFVVIFLGVGVGFYATFRKDVSTITEGNKTVIENQKIINENQTKLQQGLPVVHIPIIDPPK
jgi:hypothetical protein